MDWDDFRYFSAIARVGSVRGAADVLGVNASTVTRRLDHLEARLGVRLFNRTRSGLQITDEGSEVIHDLDAVAADLGEIERRLQGRDAEMAGPLSIALPDVLVGALMQQLVEFTGEHRRIRLEILPDPAERDPPRRAVDISLRLTDEPPETLVGSCLGRLRVTAYASLDYLSRHDPLLAAGESCWVESELETLLAPDFRSEHFAAMTLAAKCHNLVQQLAAVRSGMGITLLPCCVGDIDPALSRIAGIRPVDTREIWLLFHPDLRRVARVHTFAEYLQQTFVKLEDALLGNLEDPQARLP
ncbi:MAG: LysR family transcriptional regulator [Pseudomonadales bacterium]